jgi:hypothetical protein
MLEEQSLFQIGFFDAKDADSQFNIAWQRLAKGAPAIFQ